MPTIGIFEAKTRLSEIIRQVEAGERFTITVRGRAVVDVVPTRTLAHTPSKQEKEAAIERLRNQRISNL